jgi:hypothetical protein
MPCASQLLPSRDVRPAATLLPADLLLLPYTCLAMMDTVEPGCVRTVLDNAATLVGVSYHGKTKLPQLHSTSIAFHTFGVTSFHHLREPKDPRGSHIACHAAIDSNRKKDPRSSACKSLSPKPLLLILNI